MRRKRLSINISKNSKNTSVNRGINFKNSKIYVLSCVCGILAVLSIFMTIDSATSGNEVANLQKKQTALLVEQQELQESLVESLSVNSLEERSVEMGFVKVGNLVYVSTSVPVASLQ